MVKKHKTKTEICEICKLYYYGKTGILRYLFQEIFTGKCTTVNYLFFVFRLK